MQEVNIRWREIDGGKHEVEEVNVRWKTASHRGGQSQMEGIKI